MRVLATAIAVLAAAPAFAQPAVFGIRDGTPRLTLADGNFMVQPVARLDLDSGGYFGQGRPGGFDSGVNVRRGRLGVEGTAFREFEYNFTWDFAPDSPQGQSNGGSIYELQAAYAGLRWATFRVGAWKLLHTLEFSGSSFGLLFMERPAITTLVASLASGNTRVAAGMEARGERWFASGYVTGGVLSTLHDDRQRGLVGRAAWRPVDGGIKVQVGLNGAWQFRPGDNSSEAVRLRDYPELRIDPSRLLDTGSVAARGAWAIGPELSGLIGKAYYAAEYYRIGVEARQGGDRGFGGWYAALAYPLLGEARRLERSIGSWSRPRAPDLDPAAGQWGALELAGRYSTADLNDGPTRGGRQSVWSVGLNWYPVSKLRFTVQYQNGRVALDGADRDFQAVGMRLSFNL